MSTWHALVRFSLRKCVHFSGFKACSQNWNFPDSGKRAQLVLPSFLLLYSHSQPPFDSIIKETESIANVDMSPKQDLNMETALSRSTARLAMNCGLR